MKTLAENLTQYAAYHRDRRNIATHFAGVPMIVFAIVLALSTWAFAVGTVPITLAAVVCVAASLYYFRLDLLFGAVMAATLLVMCAIASEVTHRLSVPAALGLAAAIFVVGWALQFLGHRYEGVKPAFYDDAKQLLIGPLFVCAEVLFALGAKGPLQRYVEERVGPTVPRRDGRALPLGPDPLPDPLPRERENLRAPLPDPLPGPLPRERENLRDPLPGPLPRERENLRCPLPDERETTQ